MDTLMLIVSYLGVLGLAFYAGYRVSGWITETAMKELMREAGISDDEIEAYIRSALKGKLEPIQEQTEGIRIRIEKIDGNLFCYEKATNRFLGQASNKDDLTDVLTQTLGPAVLLVSPEDGAEYLKEGTVQ